MQDSAVDESDAAQVEHQRRPVRRDERLQLLLELGRVREVELTADTEQNPLRIVGALGLELERRHAISRHDLRGGVKSSSCVRLPERPCGYMRRTIVDDDLRTVLVQDFRIDGSEYVGGTRTAVLAVHGDADMSVADVLTERLTEVIDQGPSIVVLDLSEATFLDSVVLGVLLHALRRLETSGGHLRIVAPQTEIRRIFELTLLDRLFELDSSREEALAATARSS